MYLQRKDNKLLMKWNQNRIKSKNNIKKSQNNSERERERVRNENDKEIPKERCISLKERQKNYW